MIKKKGKKNNHWLYLKCHITFENNKEILKIHCMVTDAILYEHLSQIPVNNISSQFHKDFASNIIINQRKNLWFRRNDTSPNYFSYFFDCIYYISISSYIQICNKNVIKGASLRSAASWMITSLHKGKYQLIFKFRFIRNSYLFCI